MTSLSWATLVRKYTKQTSTSLADAELQILADWTEDEIADEIAQSDIKGNYFIVPDTDDLIASQREYAWPDDILSHLYSVEVAFSSTVDSFGQLPYVLAKKDDFRKWNLSRTEANITGHYSNNFPKFEVQRRAIYLLSGKIDATTLGASTITNAIRIRYRAYPAHIADLTENTQDLSVDPTTTTFGMPRQFHELWARRASIAWKAEHPGAVPPTQLDADYPRDLANKLQSIMENDFSGETLATLPTNDSHNSDGYDL